MVIRSRWVAAVALVACHSGSGAQPDAAADAPMAAVDAPAGPMTSWTEIGPQGGFFPSVAFQPGHAGVVWASGDDAGGLYKSTDGGATWALVPTGAPNESTYALRFDPSDASTLFAPNHFGRGMLRSADGGATWTAAQAGLPISGTASQALDDLAIAPASSSIVFAATDAGLYKSTDGGATFALATTTLAGGVGVRSLAFRSDGILFIGKADGAFGFTTDNGGTWTQVLAPNGISLDVLVFSQTAIYVGYRNAAIFRLDKTSLASTPVNDPSQAGTIENANRLSIAVASGASAVTDTVFVGTMGVSTIPAARWGLFKSTNGGGTWTQTMTGMAGNGIMSIAIDPADANNVVVGSGAGPGVCHSSNGAATWTCVTAGLFATASLALAQDPTTGGHLLASNTACGGFSANYETTDGGATWTRFADPVVDDGIFAFDVDPAAPIDVLAGTCTQGIVRSTGGIAGTWSRVTATAGQRVDRFVRDHATTATVYAVVPTGDATHSLYVSTTGGAAFTARTGVVWNVAVHPTHAGELIALAPGDALASTDAFATSHSLGLTAHASAEGGLTAAAFDPANPATVVVAGASGGLYKTTTYDPSGTGVTWTALASPVIAAAIRDIVIVVRGGRSIYYVATSAGDTGVTATSTSGVFRSLDGGATWTTISATLAPSSIVWRLIPDVRAPSTTLLAGMWAGGLFQLTDTE